MKKRNGFTLVELLAVIVILAIILVIAVPSIMNTIADARKSSYKSTAMMVARAAETQYMVAETLGTLGKEGGFAKGDADHKQECGAWAGTTQAEHGTCEYWFVGTTAHVTLTGPTGDGSTSKFKNCVVADGTKTDAEVTGNNCGK